MKECGKKIYETRTYKTYKSNEEKDESEKILFFCFFV